MKIVKVQIDEFKNLKDFAANIDGQNIILLGDNEVGKTSFLQFIEIALGNQKVIPPNINGGGEIVTEINGKQVKFKLDLVDGKPIIKVRGEGISIDNKKGAIAELVGAVEFDIDNFVNLSKTTAGRKQQVDEFKKFLDADTIAILNKCEANVKNHFEERTNINRDIKNLEGAIKLSPMYNHQHELEKFTAIDVTDVMTKLKDAQENNTKILKVKQDCEIINSSIEKAQKEIKELQAKIDAYNAEIDLGIEKINKANEWFKTHSEIDTTPYDNIINSASETNKKASDADKLKYDMKKISDLKELSGEKTVLIETERECIQQAIREMDTPVSGLSFDDEQLLYNGVSVNPDCLSTSTIGELGVKLKRAENPNLPILLRCGESWGAKRIQWLKDLSANQDFQIIMEKVDTSKDKLTIEIMGS